MKLSKRALKISASPTLALNAKVTQLQTEGQVVINLTAGQLDFPTPTHIKRAGIKAIKDNITRYTPTAGILELKEAVAEKLSRISQIPTTPSQVVVGVGSKQLLYHAFQVLCNPGDEVILATPTWTTYVEQIKLAGAKPKLIKLKSPFILTAEKIKSGLSKKSKAILINSPANPTGAVIPRGELKKIARLAVENSLAVVTDEIYESFCFKKPHVSIASLNKQIAKQTITINGVSKAYAMTGWRVGYATGPSEIIQKMVAIQSQTTSNTSSISQMAALKALTGSQESVKLAREKLLKRRDFLIDELSKLSGLKLVKPEGAFYFFVSIDELLGGKYKTSEEWCQALLKNEGVALVPGEAFLTPKYFRLSFATPMTELKKAVKGIKKFIESYEN